MADTRPYRPGSGTEGAAFLAQWCDRCVRDDAFQRGIGDSCPIVAATMRLYETDDGYPPEWVEDAGDDGPGNPRCTAFEPMDRDAPGVIQDARQPALDLGNRNG